MNFKSMKNELAKKVFCVANRLMSDGYGGYGYPRWRRISLWLFKPEQEVDMQYLKNSSESEGRSLDHLRFIGYFATVPGINYGDDLQEEFYEGFMGFTRRGAIRRFKEYAEQYNEENDSLEGFSADLAEA